MSQRKHTTVFESASAHGLARRSGGWAIKDANGLTIVDNLPDRALAVRRLGHFAVSDHPLPLRVVSPDGSPSGDMIG